MEAWVEMVETVEILEIPGPRVQVVPVTRTGQQVRTEPRGFRGLETLRPVFRAFPACLRRSR
jgi:hypothetical protein